MGGSQQAGPMVQMILHFREKLSWLSVKDESFDMSSGMDIAHWP